MNIQEQIKQQEEEFDEVMKNELPLADLSHELQERALGTMNYQLKVSLGREPITSASDTNLLTEEDLKTIDEIKKNKLKAWHRNSIKSILEGLVEREKGMLEKWNFEGIESFYNQAKQDTITYLESEIKKIQDNKKYYE